MGDSGDRVSMFSGLILLGTDEVSVVTTKVRAYSL